MPDRWISPTSRPVPHAGIWAPGFEGLLRMSPTAPSLPPHAQPSLHDTARMRALKLRWRLSLSSNLLDTPQVRPNKAFFKLDNPRLWKTSTLLLHSVSRSCWYRAVRGSKKVPFLVFPGLASEVLLLVFPGLATSATEIPTQTKGLGFGGLGIRVYGLGFRVQGLRFTAKGFRV